MITKEQVVSVTAYRIYQDARFNLKPQSNDGAATWLQIARRWARDNCNDALASQMDGYLSALGESYAPIGLELTPSFA